MKKYEIIKAEIAWTLISGLFLAGILSSSIIIISFFIYSAILHNDFRFIYSFIFIYPIGLIFGIIFSFILGAPISALFWYIAHITNNRSPERMTVFGILAGAFSGALICFFIVTYFLPNSQPLVMYAVLSITGLISGYFSGKLISKKAYLLSE